MGRALTGSRWERGGRFYASLPVAKGATRRVEAGFDDESERECWVTAGIAALDAGRPVPPPARLRRSHLSHRSAPAEDGRPMPAFEMLAYGWLDEYYGRLRRADAERERSVRTMVENHLIPAFAGPIPADPAVARERLVAFVRRMAAEPEWAAEDDSGSDGGARLLTVRQATTFCARSEATIRRALRDRRRRLPGARRDLDGSWLVPLSDLVAAGIGEASAAPSALSRNYATQVLWAHNKILEWGRLNGWSVPEFERDVSALTPDAAVARKRPDAAPRQPLSVAEVARVAAHLHVVHQLTLWLMRVLGLRIGEAFGPRVGDVVDLGELGLIFIERQGGRAFLRRTRNGIETSHSKDALKREASYRVIVVPAPLMALVRVVVEAFHTDPDTGETDLEARLVPWIGKEGRGQSAFRSATEAALRQVGLEFGIADLEVTSHHFRKSLATDLAWNGDLDELAKRRVLGHKAGDDVFARVYTLDHPTLAPLVAVAEAVEATIVEAVPTLMVPTERRVRWPRTNPLQARVDYVDAVLAEAGWQVDPGGWDNPWCETETVAAELGIAVTTARRWMRDQVVPSTTDTDEHGNPRRRSRLHDVRALKQQFAARILLRDVAAEIGVGYHRAWHALRRLGIGPERDPRTDELLLSAKQADCLRTEFERQTGLLRRSMRLSAAATTLEVSVAEVLRLLRSGDLDEDAERDAHGARYVTRASVEALLNSRRPPAPLIVGVDVVSLEAVTKLTGLTRLQVRQLADQGVLTRIDVDRRFHVSVDSVRRWATAYRPELLANLPTGEDAPPPRAMTG